MSFAYLQTANGLHNCKCGVAEYRVARSLQQVLSLPDGPGHAWRRLQVTVVLIITNPQGLWALINLFKVSQILFSYNMSQILTFKQNVLYLIQDLKVEWQGRNGGI